MSGGDVLGLLVAMGSLISILAIGARTILRYQEQRLRARGAPQDAAVRAELEEMRAQLAEQQDVRQRLLELEERMDFAERLLVRHPDQAKLPEGR